ncbi:hypothetical protein JTF19_17350, partial [Enterobacteriaceae bacterium RIT814]|nr:hypothetical protein [Enterobacteriaceae bacterium RIT 814]
MVAKTANSAITGAGMVNLVKKNTVRNFFQIYSCHRRRTPYNAPPLTRNNGLQAAGLAGFRDERQQRKAKINA